MYHGNNLKFKSKDFRFRFMSFLKVHRDLCEESNFQLEKIITGFYESDLDRQSYGSSEMALKTNY